MIKNGYVSLFGLLISIYLLFINFNFLKFDLYLHFKGGIQNKHILLISIHLGLIAIIILSTSFSPNIFNFLHHFRIKIIGLRVKSIFSRPYSCITFSLSSIFFHCAGYMSIIFTLSGNVSISQYLCLIIYFCVVRLVQFDNEAKVFQVVCCYIPYVKSAYSAVAITFAGLQFILSYVLIEQIASQLML